MGYVPERLHTILIPSGPGKHLFCIVTDQSSAGQHLLLNFSTIYPERFHDPTCVVQAGEHPFLNHPSYVEYRKAEIQRSDRLGKLVDAQYYGLGTPATEELASKMLTGVMISPHTPRHIKAFVRSILGN